MTNSERRPLVRWTCGPSNSKFDHSIFLKSVSNFRRIYGEAFDYVVCLNGRDGSGLEGLGINTFNQTPLEGMPIPKGVAWKLYPPRLRPDSHEIFIDHDLVVVDRIKKIDDFLSRPDAFLYSRSASRQRNYGRFDALVREGFELNSGLFGLPPGFEFKFDLVGEWSDYFDEQGLVAASLCRKGRLIEVGLEDVWICDKDEMPRDAKGYHFVHDRREEMWGRFVRMTSI